MDYLTIQIDILERLENLTINNPFLTRGNGAKMMWRG